MTDQHQSTNDDDDSDDRDTEESNGPTPVVDSMMKEPTDTDHPTGQQRAAENAQNESPA